jgi:putative heme-binding domain-containing protein
LNETLTKCVACHKVNEQGGEAGPDLTHRRQVRPATLIESLLEPSRQIVEGYRTTTILARWPGAHRHCKGTYREAGDVLRCERKRMILATAEIEQSKDSFVSLMPQNLMDRLAGAVHRSSRLPETLRWAANRPGAGITADQASAQL